MSLNAAEGRNLIPAQEHLRRIGFWLQEEKVDGSYPSYENIARSETAGTRLIYRIQKRWVYNKKGTAENVKRVYQRYHNRDDFVPNANINFMLIYLCERGEYEVAGAYLRNLRMEYAKRHPAETKKETGERSQKARMPYIYYLMMHRSGPSDGHRVPTRTHML